MTSFPCSVRPEKFHPYIDSMKVWRFLRPQFVQPGRLSITFPGDCDIDLFESSDVHAVIAKSMETIKVWQFLRPQPLSKGNHLVFPKFYLSPFSSCSLCLFHCVQQRVWWPTKLDHFMRPQPPQGSARVSFYSLSFHLWPGMKMKWHLSSFLPSFNQTHISRHFSRKPFNW